MKRQFNTLEKLIESLQEKLDQMDETFWERSDTWQDSEKGQEFDDTMSGLEAVIGELECAKDSLEELL